MLTHVGDAWLALGDVQSARRAWQDALAILDDLHPAQAAEVRAKLHNLDSGGALGLVRVNLAGPGRQEAPPDPGMVNP